MEPRRSPDTRRVRLLYIGIPEPDWLPYLYLTTDPFFEVHSVPAHVNLYRWDDLRRWTRLYMPKTYDRLIEDYDVVALWGANPLIFPDRTHRWIHDAVIKEGLGIKIYGLGTYHFADWMEFTCLGEVFPVRVVNADATMVWSELRILRPKNPLASSLPFENIGSHGFFPGFMRLRASEGSEVIADLVPEYGSPNPFMVWWDLGEGRSFVSSVVPGSRRFGCPICEWQFLPDMISNTHLFVAAVDIPPDPVILHEVRRALYQYRMAKKGLISTVEFIAIFGANTIPVEQMMNRADEKIVELGDMYLDLKLQECLNLAEELIANLHAAGELAVELKNQALLWIYVVEWLAMTGTLMVSGFVVWTLMVRRRLYREIGHTRLRKSGVLT